MKGEGEGRGSRMVVEGEDRVPWLKVELGKMEGLHEEQGSHDHRHQGRGDGLSLGWSSSASALDLSVLLLI